MRIPKDTLLAFAAASCGAAIVDAASVVAVTRNKPMTPEQVATATASVALVTSLSIGCLGLAVGGWGRPNSYARGLVWAGGLGVVGAVATFVKPPTVGEMMRKTSA